MKIEVELDRSGGELHYKGISFRWLVWAVENGSRRLVGKVWASYKNLAVRKGLSLYSEKKKLNE